MAVSAVVAGTVQVVEAEVSVRPLMFPFVVDRAGELSWASALITQSVALLSLFCGVTIRLACVTVTPRGMLMFWNRMAVVCVAEPVGVDTV
jgi:hypothetical protein